MKLKGCNLLLLMLLVQLSALAQSKLSGVVSNAESGKVLAGVEVYCQELNYSVTTTAGGAFMLTDLTPGTYSLILFASGYNTLQQSIYVSSDSSVDFLLEPYSQELSEVIIQQKREEVFGLNRLNPVEGTAIYAGKKSEVVLLDRAVLNRSANNARQIYSQVVGLNIYENNDAGLQLNIGGRGLDPNRTSNFNTRQNGYDISADVLGYPESYYTPTAEGLSEIQVIRGAASLQYGTQFGGLVNFKMKEPIKGKPIEWVSRQGYASFNLFTSFNSLSGQVGKFSYYTFFNYKSGDGFRPNSGFEAKNFFASLSYELTPKSKLTFESTWLNYLAQQPGGLTDSQFEEDINFSNRERNWFEVDWRLYALKYQHKFSTKNELSIQLFGLNAERNALGFRGDPKRPERNPITEPDDPSFTRDLIKGEFNNWGAEARYLHRYNLGEKSAVFLVGTKYYQARNTSRQGPGPMGSDADFRFVNDEVPSYPNQSDFTFPNLNFALFGENIFVINDKLSITPGFRIEYIDTESQGEYLVVRFDNAGNEIFRKDTTDNRTFERSLVLLGVGVSYTYPSGIEMYGNISQNYRSVTFSDIRVVNPTFIIDPNIRDEDGFTADIGIRGKFNRTVSFDLGVYTLKYNDRIGTVLVQNGPNKGDRVRKNIGDAIIYGLESFIDWNMVQSFGWNNQKLQLNPFLNLALTDSQYTKSEENNVEGKKVEFIPQFNMKTGVRFGYGNLLGSIQFTALSKQYTDAENSEAAEPGDSREGIIGEIPAYNILDLSLSYRWKLLTLETGINNLLNEEYFTRRATGYPGPGIIPSDPRSFYATLQIKL